MRLDQAFLPALAHSAFSVFLLELVFAPWRIMSFLSDGYCRRHLGRSKGEKRVLVHTTSFSSRHTLHHAHHHIGRIRLRLA